jgi:hypothetical protein
MKILLFLGIIYLTSCGTVKNQTPMVQGIVQIHQPYCGGARPKPEVAKGTFSPYKNATFYIKSKMSNDAKNIVAKVTTNENGEFSANLAAGKYVVIHEDKTKSLEEYIRIYNVPANNQVYIGEKDAMIQYKSADMEIVVEENKPIEITYNAKCFIGINRLVKYTGPLPQ